ncbi:MAG: glycosyltransferase family 39 protein [Candidatus Gastranaerophilaceae bacterium]
MKKLLAKISEKLTMRVEDTFGASIKDKWLNSINAHPELFCILLLVFACLIFLFLGLNFYPLMDVDETRYAVIARDLARTFDWNDLAFNYVPFLEKPPLYFWIVANSIKFFGGFSAFAVRLPIAMLSTFIVFFTYYLGKRVISRKFGMISALILLSSIFFLILSHIAIIDMVLTVLMTTAIYLAFLTHFCEEKNKKYYWWYFYLLMGLGFLAKGILALAIPFLVILVYNLITKTAKEIFKPTYIIPGILIFLMAVLPWHLSMYREFGNQFIREYFLVHHFARFMNSVNIGRERPFWYFIPVFLLGFMPWTFAFISFLCDGFKKLTAKFKATEGKLTAKIGALFEATTNEQKLLLFASVNFIVIFLVFSSSSTKLPTYILPLFPAASMLTGYYWWVSDEKGEHEKSIYNSTIIFSIIFMLAAATATVAFYFLPDDIQYKISAFNQPTITAMYLLAMYLVLRLNTKRALSIFSGYILIMVFVITLAVSQIFNFVYATGENEIVRFSSYGSGQENSSQLVTFDFAVKPSAMIKYTDKVDFLTDADFVRLDQLLKYKAGPTFVIVKNKNFENDPNYLKKIKKRLELLQTGEKYSLYVKDVHNEYNNEPECCFGAFGPDSLSESCSHKKSRKHHRRSNPDFEPEPMPCP